MGIWLKFHKISRKMNYWHVGIAFILGFILNPLILGGSEINKGISEFDPINFSTKIANTDLNDFKDKKETITFDKTCQEVKAGAEVWTGSEDAGEALIIKQCRKSCGKKDLAYESYSCQNAQITCTCENRTE